MKQTIITGTALLAMGLMSFCSPDEQDQSAALTDDCTFTYSAEDTSVEWTAFKFTEKAAVGGGFNTFQINGTADASSQLDVFKNASFTIDTTSVDSGNDGRDARIKEHFFSNMSEQGIQGSVKSIDGSNGVIAITMNGQSQDVPVQLTVDGRDVVLTGAIDVNNWDASGPLAALNEVCKALHTGSDKVSKLWPDVDIKLQTSLKADCK